MVGGAAAVDATMDSLTARCNCTTLRLDAGDEMQGTLPSNLAYGRTTIEALDLMGIQAAAVGNHDFDWSADTLRARMRESDYPWVAANIFDSTTGKRPDWVMPWRMVRAGKYQVAVVGFITSETKQIVAPQNIARPHVRRRLPAHPRRGRGGAQRQARPPGAAGPLGRPVRLALLRRGDLRPRRVPARRAAWTSSCPATATRCSTRSGTASRSCRPGAAGRAVGVVDVIKTADGGRKIDVDVRTVWVDQVTPDSALVRARGARRADHRQPGEPGHHATSRSRCPGPANQYPLGNLIADAFRNVLRADVALVNNGGVRADVAAGRLTYGQLFTVMPFQNQAVTRHADRQAAARGGGGVDHRRRTGRARLRACGSPTTCRAPPGSACARSAWPTARSRRTTRRYTLAVNYFLAAGAERLHHAADGAAGRRTRMSDIEVMELYLRRLPRPVQPPEDARFIPEGE